MPAGRTSSPKKLRGLIYQSLFFIHEQSNMDIPCWAAVLGSFKQPFWDLDFFHVMALHLLEWVTSRLSSQEREMVGAGSGREHRKYTQS